MHSEHPDMSLPQSDTAAELPNYEQSLIAEHGAEAVAAYRAEVAPELRFGDPATALEVGATAPPFTLADAVGMPYALTELLRTGPVVAIFYRGGWCPFCNVHLRAFQLARTRLRALKATVVLISPERLQASLSLIERHSLQFPVLTDVGNVLARQYGVAVRLDVEQRKRHLANEIDLVAYNDDEHWELPMPATFVIDRAQRIRYAFVSADYTQRAEPNEVLAVLQRIAAGR
jgi:peroxiredoxin